MRVTFVANFMNHHQLQFSEEMMRLTNNQYTFIAHSPLYSEQADLGYVDMNHKPFVIRIYEDNEAYDRGIEKIKNDDIVIFGGCPNEFIEIRCKAEKPFLIYSERFFKKGLWRRFIPRTYKSVYERMLKFEAYNMKVICSSAYLPYELGLLKSNISTLKWGYFPEMKQYQDINSIIKLKPPASILWVGRFIELKHPELMIEVAKRLVKDGYDFKLQMIGTGKLKKKIERLVLKNHLEERVIILGAMPPTQVREYMEKASIYMFTSNYREGWGAVLNESMNSACAVIACDAAGAVPYLIKNEENGLLYHLGDKNKLYQNVKYLLDNPAICQNMGRKAYYTIVNEWNATVASERLYAVMEAMVNNMTIPKYKNGPCSIADRIDPKKKVNYDNK